MKSIIKNIKSRLYIGVVMAGCLLLLTNTMYAQDDSSATAEPIVKTKPILKPVKNTFYGNWIIDNQTVMVPVKGAFEMEIQHRFGPVSNGYEDFWGLFAPSNIRLGVQYVPINNLSIGGGITKINKIWDISAKYAILKQTPGKFPVSVTYYSNMAFDTRKNVDSSLFKYNSQRYSFFNQILIARKFSDKLSLQASISLTHQNSVNGFYTKNDSTGHETFLEMFHDHLAASLSGKYKVSEGSAFIFDYNQPLTKHHINNPAPSASFGFEMHTSGHSFQIFFTNYFYLNPQRNNLFNQNSPLDYTKDDAGTKVSGGKYLLGFNITRLW
jgi:hypothetical protein